MLVATSLVLPRWLSLLDRACTVPRMRLCSIDVYIDVCSLVFLFDSSSVWVLGLLLCVCIGRDAVEDRVVSSGDALVTLVSDTTQVVLLVLSCRRFDEPFFQIGVRPPAVVLRVVTCQAVGW